MCVVGLEIEASNVTARQSRNYRFPARPAHIPGNGMGRGRWLPLNADARCGQKVPGARDTFDLGISGFSYKVATLGSSYCHMS